jgi:hypothetical protein
VAEEPPQPTEEQLRQLEEELRKITIADVLVQTVVTVSSLGFQRLAAEHRDLDQARLAIEALRALVPVLAEAVPAETMRDLNQTVANLQLAYAKAASEAKPAAEAKPESPVRGSGPREGAPSEPEGSPG